METAAPNDAKLTRQAALPQLGLRPEATEQEVEAAYTAAAEEIDLMTRNARSEALSASYRRAREQIEQAYRVLKQARPEAPPATINPETLATGTAPVSRAAVMRDMPVEVSMAPAHERAPSTAESSAALSRAQQEAARSEAEAAKAREEAAKSRSETAEALRIVEELRGQSAALSEEVGRVRDRLKSLSEEAEALRQTVSQLGGQASRELEAMADVRKRADGLLISAQRNESEIATAAMHAEAYRDSAMYAAQAAERVLRALSAETTNM